MTKEEFAKVFIPVSIYYGKNLEDTSITLYYNAFQDIDIELFKKAMTRVIKTMKFFPKISEITEELEGNAFDKKAEAWGYVMANIGNASKMTYDKPAPQGVHETIKRMGGWFNVGLWHVDSLSFKKNEFFELFTSEEEVPLLSSEFKELLKLQYKGVQ